MSHAASRVVSRPVSDSGADLLLVCTVAVSWSWVRRKLEEELLSTMVNRRDIPDEHLSCRTRRQSVCFHILRAGGERSRQEKCYIYNFSSEILEVNLKSLIFCQAKHTKLGLALVSD